MNPIAEAVMTEVITITMTITITITAMTADGAQIAGIPVILISVRIGDRKLWMLSPRFMVELIRLSNQLAQYYRALIFERRINIYEIFGNPV